MRPEIIEKRKSFLWELSKKQIAEIVRYFFIILFIYASLRKLIDHEMYYNEISYFPLLIKNSRLPIIHEVGGWAFWLICGFEIISAFMLIFKKLRLLGLYLAFVILIAITIYLLALIQFSKLIPIYFGAIFPTVSIFGHIILNMLFILILIISLPIKPKLH